MNTKHTPGPWYYITGAVFAGPDKRIPIAYMDRQPGNGTRPTERDANARLIAEAPAMADLIRRVLVDPTNAREIRFDSKRECYVVDVEGGELEAARTILARRAQSRTT